MYVKVAWIEIELGIHAVLLIFLDVFVFLLEKSTYTTRTQGVHTRSIFFSAEMAGTFGGPRWNDTFCRKLKIRDPAVLKFLAFFLCCLKMCCIVFLSHMFGPSFCCLFFFAGLGTQRSGAIREVLRQAGQAWQGCGATRRSGKKGRYNTTRHDTWEEDVSNTEEPLSLPEETRFLLGVYPTISVFPWGSILTVYFSFSVGYSLLFIPFYGPCATIFVH